MIKMFDAKDKLSYSNVNHLSELNYKLKEDQPIIHTKGRHIWFNMYDLLEF